MYIYIYIDVLMMNTRYVKELARILKNSIWEGKKA